MIDETESERCEYHGELIEQCRHCKKLEAPDVIYHTTGALVPKSAYNALVRRVKSLEDSWQETHNDALYWCNRANDTAAELAAAKAEVVGFKEINGIQKTFLMAAEKYEQELKAEIEKLKNEFNEVFRPRLSQVQTELENSKDEAKNFEFCLHQANTRLHDLIPSYGAGVQEVARLQHRTKELEAENQKLAEIQLAVVANIKEKEQRLIKALEFYADEKHHPTVERGNTARDALKKHKEGIK